MLSRLKPPAWPRGNGTEDTEWMLDSDLVAEVVGQLVVDLETLVVDLVVESEWVDPEDILRYCKVALSYEMILSLSSLLLTVPPAVDLSFSMFAFLAFLASLILFQV